MPCSLAWLRSVATVAALALGPTRAFAAPPEPSGPHPRMLLDAALSATWREQARRPDGPVAEAMRVCEHARTTREHDQAVYQGAEWARVLQACLVAYAATGQDAHAVVAIRFFEALLDDLDTIGDARGGDAAGRRDSGYALRNLGPYTALAYDWLHAHARMTPALRARARQRWAAWLGWYRDHGYRARDPGSNYHAGYLAAATLIAVAQGSEAGSDGAALWAHVTSQMWGVAMRQALGAHGILAGGDWPEGWQYGPLAVAEYALAARVAAAAGVEVPGIATWLTSLLRRHVHALSPGAGVYPGGDTEAATPTIAPHALTLDAIALGDAPAQDRAWARGELRRLGLVARDAPLFDALAAAGPPPQARPRDAWPRWYVAENTGTLYARTRWDPGGVWLVVECHGAIETDHRHPTAGTFVLSRGRDDVIVDPSPYDSHSTLTSNAPTVLSPQLPPAYHPGQGVWGEEVGFDLVTQRASGVVAARCDYADAFRFQHRPSDVAEAIRDLVLLPSTDGRDAALVVIDRADTGSSTRDMHLRFRTPGPLARDTSGRATATVGASRLAISRVDGAWARAGAAPPAATIVTTSRASCSDEREPPGLCDAARFPVTDYRVRVQGPRPVAVHLLEVAGHSPLVATARAIGGDRWAGVLVSGTIDAAILWRPEGAGPLAYVAPPGTHVILDAADRASLAAVRARGGCAVTVSATTTSRPRPLVARVDPSCRIELDPEAPGAPPARRAARSRPPVRDAATSDRPDSSGARRTRGAARSVRACRSVHDDPQGHVPVDPGVGPQTCPGDRGAGLR